MKTKIFLTVLFLSSVVVFAQEKSINNYKYIIVKKKFNFLHKPDQHKTSSLLKFLFNKNEFKAFLNDDELPEELAKNNCLALTAEVKNNSNFFTTKNTIVLTDCYNQVIYKTKEGESKSKDYKKAYHEAIRNAFNDIKRLHYVFKSIKKPSVKVVAVPKTIISKTIIPVNKTIKNVLYAQPIINGFQLVNNKPNVVFQILNTTKNDVFLIKDKNGILYKKGDKWIAEYYQNNQLIQEEYQIKF